MHEEESRGLGSSHPQPTNKPPVETARPRPVPRRPSCHSLPQGSLCFCRGLALRLSRCTRQVGRHLWDG